MSRQGPENVLTRSRQSPVSNSGFFNPLDEEPITKLSYETFSKLSVCAIRYICLYQISYMGVSFIGIATKAKEKELIDAIKQTNLKNNKPVDIVFENCLDRGNSCNTSRYNMRMSLTTSQENSSVRLLGKTRSS
jgi:hypothetical protein